MQSGLTTLLQKPGILCNTELEEVAMFQAMQGIH